MKLRAFFSQMSPRQAAIILYFAAADLTLLIVAVVALITNNLFAAWFTFILVSLLIKLPTELFLQKRDIKRELIRIAQIVFASCGINFILFIALSFLFGGDALNGKFENGNYFLFFNGGTYTQVSFLVFYINKLHGIAVIFNFLLVFMSPVFIDGRFRRKV